MPRGLSWKRSNSLQIIHLSFCTVIDAWLGSCSDYWRMHYWKRGVENTIFSLRCPNDATLKYLSAPSFSSQRFSLEAFKFIADHPFVFVHCHVIVCNATDPKCVKGCSSGERGRREASTHVTDVYSLAQGPIQLVLEKREEKQSGGLDMRGMYTYKRPVSLTICMQNK